MCWKTKMNNLEFNKKIDAFRNSIETKENFVCAEITENDLYDFIFYKVYNGNANKMYEDLTDYYSDEYDRYCDDIITGWTDDDDFE